MTKTEILKLLNKMTLEEKIGQLVQIAGEIYLEDKKNISTGPLKNLELLEENLYNIGSILNTIGAEKVIKIQKKYLSKNRLKIPLLFMADIINGYKTVFPIPIAQGCSWNIELIKKCKQIEVKEALIAGANVNFSPMVDLCRDARWGRVMESTGGEDSYLGALYGKVIIQALQGKKLTSKKIAACAKHFAAYGAVEAGREYNTVDISEREFRQNYLHAYSEAIKNGVEMIMTSFNTINGIPSTVNKWLLSDILRKELKFKGIVISDYSAIEETIAHGISKDKKEAAYKAIKAGVDIDMMSGVYINNLKKLVEENKITEKEIDKSVLRVLNLKNKLGLFENPYGNTNQEKEKEIILSKKNLKEARKLTSETFVLLKNKNNILPIKEKKKISLIGPYIDNIAITGSWSMFSDKSKIPTIKNIIEKRIGKENILYAKGSEILTKKEINEILIAEKLPLIEVKDEKKLEKQLLKQAIETAKKSEIIILAIGEHYKQSGEGCSRSNLKISNIQINLINELYKLKIPIITILFNGRPIELDNIERKTDALLEVWFPGTEGANAIADIIFGDVNPSGKLTMSFPQNVGQCPIYYNHYNTGRPNITNYRYTSKYQDIPTKSFYQFGYGMSYSKFKYIDLKLNNNKITKKEKIIATITIKNESKYSGYEIIQLYIQDLYASVVRPVKELKDFKKEFFKPFEEKKINFEINIEMLKFLNEDLKYVIEEGEFKVYIGTDSKNNLSKKFNYKK